MEAEENLLFLLQNPHLPADLKHIAEKVLQNERITFDEGVLLYEKGELGCEILKQDQVSSRGAE